MQFIGSFSIWFKSLPTVQSAALSDQTIRKIASHLHSEGYADRHSVSQFDIANWLDVLTNANTAMNLGLDLFPKKGHLTSLGQASLALRK